MNKTLTALATIAILAAPHAMAEGKSYTVGAFDSIEVDGAMKVIYKTGAETSVSVETPSGDYSDAKITSSGDTLTVSRESLGKKGSWFSWGNRSVSVSDDGKTVKVNGKKVPAYTVYVTSPALVSVSAAQASRFQSQTIKADAFSASASSNSEIVIAGTAASADLSASSSGELDAAGLRAGVIEADVSSSGELDATVTGAGQSEIAVSSAGELNLTSTGTGTFIVNASSGSSAELTGACQSINVIASSGASVDADGLRCVEATANASSGADVELFASSEASGNASSGAEVSFSGKPKNQDVSKSSGGSVSFSD